MKQTWSDGIQFHMQDLSWERVFLNFEIEADAPGNFHFGFLPVPEEERTVRVGTSPAGHPIELRPESAAGNRFSFSVNICSVKDRSFLENGQWRLCAWQGEKVYPVFAELKIAYRADDLSRVFKYGKDKYAYNLSFVPNEVLKGQVELLLASYFLIVNPTWKRRRYVQEMNTASDKCRRFGIYSAILLLRGFYFIASRLLPKNGRNVLFMTETNDHLTGNLKQIYTRMKKRKLDREYKIRVSCRNETGKRYGPVSWLKVMYDLAASDYIFVDNYAPILGFFKLNKKTRLIQLWHAGVGFKSVGYSRFGKEGSPFPSESGYKQASYAIVGSENLRKVYQEVFGIEEEAVLPLGMARLDGFLDPDKIDSFRKKFFADYPELQGKEIILFAPTFRGMGQPEAHYDYEQLDFQALYDFCGEDTVILFKMHPFIKGKVPIPDECRDRLFDFSDYLDINELYYVADLLITDYSSDFYEFALLGKPILFFTYDREVYELTHGVHRRIKEMAPGKVCDSFEELMQALQEQDYDFEKTKQFAEENFSAYDGQAADRIIDQILKP